MVREQPTKRTMASQLADSVRNDIVSGKLAPGSRVNLNDLSKHYRVGINPLREALSRLSTTKFVTAEDQRGFRVSEISLKELVDTQQIRIELECLALRAAIANGGVVWESEIIAAHHRLSRIQSTPKGGRLALDKDWETAHCDFHHALLSASSSEWLKIFIATLFEYSTRYRNAVVLSTGRIKRNVAGEHQGLMEAVLDKDADMACALLTEHFNVTTRFILVSMDETKK